MRDPTIARNYAEVLLSLARKANDLEGWSVMIGDIADAMERDETLHRFLDSPRVSEEHKNRLLSTALQDRMPRLFVRFLQTLVSNRRQMLIPIIAEEYRALVDEVTGRVQARVTVAREPDEAQRQAIVAALSRAVGKQVVPHVIVNPAIMGGLIVRIGDTVMDGSVRRRLSALRSRLLAGSPTA